MEDLETAEALRLTLDLSAQVRSMGRHIAMLENQNEALHIRLQELEPEPANGTGDTAAVPEPQPQG